MAFYITVAEVKAAAPDGFVREVTRNVAGLTEQQVVEDCIQQAMDALHTYVGNKYEVPFAAPHDQNGSVKWATKRLTLYYLAERLNSTSEEWQNIKDAANDVWNMLIAIRDKKGIIPGIPLKPDGNQTESGAISLSNRGVNNVAFANHRGDGGNTLDNFGTGNRNTKQGRWQ